MKKRIVVVIILAVAVAAGIYGAKRYAALNKDGAETGLKIYGTIDIRDANLAFTEQERIVEVLVEEGARVEKGEVLARLNSDRLEATIREVTARIAAQEQVVRRLKAGSRPQEIEQARAEVDAARVRVDNSSKVLARLERTSVNGATSKQAVDDARSAFSVEQAQLQVRQKGLNLVLEGPRKEDIAAAEYQLEALQASLALLNVRLADMALKAPQAGIIQSRILEVNEMAGPTRPVFSLALNDPKWVRAYVPEPDLGRIRLGMKARVLSDSFPGQPQEGWIGFISPTAEFTPRAVQTEELRTKLVYEARVFVPDASDRLRLCMPVTVLIDDGSMDGDSASLPAQEGDSRKGV